MLIKINNDLFNISARIKNIDSEYEIYFNTKNKKFEVHNKNQKKDKYSSTLPFDRLDNRAINYLNETHIRNATKVIENIEKNNKKIEHEEKEKVNDMSTYKLNEIYKYSNMNTKTLKVDFKNIWF